jgi:hypothetical protein
MKIRLLVSPTRIGYRVKVQTPNPHQPGALMTLGVLQMNRAHLDALCELVETGGAALGFPIDIAGRLREAGRSGLAR